MTEAAPVVAILMGSQSDWDTMRHAADTLDGLGVANEARVLSAHRQAARLEAYLVRIEDAGIQVVIAGAGMAAALPGVIAAKVQVPVLGVPMESKLDGLDSLLSMVQMPAGVPVGTLAIGRAGAVNAALLAAAILALSDGGVAKRLAEYRKNQAEQPEDPRAPPPKRG
jgi:5-(carboxyamino)imidazole ribonucleotide mutase